MDSPRDQPPVHRKSLAGYRRQRQTGDPPRRQRGTHHRAPHGTEMAGSAEGLARGPRRRSSFESFASHPLPAVDGTRRCRNRDRRSFKRVGAEWETDRRGLVFRGRRAVPKRTHRLRAPQKARAAAQYSDCVSGQCSRGECGGGSQPVHGARATESRRLSGDARTRRSRFPPVSRRRWRMGATACGGTWLG